jgi:hypothetical protein
MMIKKAGANVVEFAELQKDFYQAFEEKSVNREIRYSGKQIP